MRIVAPELGELQPSLLKKDYCEELIEGKEYIDEKLDFKVLNPIEFQNCYFKKIDFSDLQTTKLRGIDLVFENCDFSNLSLGESIFHRCEFHNCKMVGTDFNGSLFQNVLLKGCSAKYINLNGSKLKYATIEETDCSSASCSQMTLQNVTLMDSKFTQAEFLHTSLEKLDFTTCTIAGIKINPIDLKGIIVTPYQALDLIGLFGIIVKDDERSF